MEEEKRSREGKLRDRLAKKRKAREQEMQEAALSDRVRYLSGLGRVETEPTFTFRVSIHLTFAPQFDGPPLPVVVSAVL